MEDAIRINYTFPKADDGANEQQNEKNNPKDGATGSYATGSDFSHIFPSFQPSRFQRRIICGLEDFLYSSNSTV